MAHNYPLPAVHIFYEFGTLGNFEEAFARAGVQTRPLAPIADGRGDGKLRGCVRFPRFYERVLHHGDVEKLEFAVFLAVSCQMQGKLEIRVYRGEVERAFWVLNYKHVHRAGHRVRDVVLDGDVVLRFVLGFGALHMLVKVGYKRAASARIHEACRFVDARVFNHRELEFAQDFVFRVVRNFRRKADFLGLQAARDLHGKFSAVRKRRERVGLFFNPHGTLSDSTGSSRSSFCV